EARISGTTRLSSASAGGMPEGAPAAHGDVLPSSQRSGKMYEKAGVRASRARSRASAARPASSLEHAGESITEWKYTNGLRAVAYGEPLAGCAVGSGAPSGGCAQAGAVDPGSSIPCTY